MCGSPPPPPSEYYFNSPFTGICEPGCHPENPWLTGFWVGTEIDIVLVLEYSRGHTIEHLMYVVLVGGGFIVTHTSHRLECVLLFAWFS